MTPADKYQVINEVFRNCQLKQRIALLCQIARVSRSGYYAWLKKAEQHAIREEQDYQDYLLLKSIYDAHRGKIGYCHFYMVLMELLETPMNHKMILRLMRKFNLSAKIRRANPYKQLAEGKQEQATCLNLLNRQFEQDEPGKVFFTDITYLPNRSGNMVYLSAVKDIASREIVAYEVTTSLTMEIVLPDVTETERSVGWQYSSRSDDSLRSRFPLHPPGIPGPCKGHEIDSIHVPSGQFASTTLRWNPSLGIPRMTLILNKPPVSRK